MSCILISGKGTLYTQCTLQGYCINGLEYTIDQLWKLKLHIATTFSPHIQYTLTFIKYISTIQELIQNQGLWGARSPEDKAIYMFQG